MRKFAPPAPKKPGVSAIKFIGYGIAIVGSAFIVWYLLLREREQKDGRDLWEQLGFPYGPIGNLPAIGADFYSGANQTDGKNSLPLLLHYTPPTTGVPLTDTLGNVLTDTLGNILTDVTTATSASYDLFTSRNADGIVDRLNHSGSKPS
jgi:hypothetical protein